MAKQDDSNPDDKFAVKPVVKLGTKHGTEVSTKIGDTPGRKLRVMGMIALVAPLFVILAGAIWLAASTWIATAGVPMSLHGYIAMTLGVGFSLVVGCGLMTLVFYSSRHGYDEPPRPDGNCE